MLTKGITFKLVMALMVLCLAVLPAGAQEQGKGKTQKQPAVGTGKKKPEVSGEEKGNPSGEVTIDVTQAAVGLGYTWGNGALKFKGKDYKFKVSGLNVIALGVTSIKAEGDVYNLKKLSDFPGKYFGVEASATLIKGSAGLLLKNSSGVVLNLKSQRKGVELRLGNEGLSISPAWE